MLICFFVGRTCLKDCCLTLRLISKYTYEGILPITLKLCMPTYLYNSDLNVYYYDVMLYDIILGRQMTPHNVIVAFT